MTQPFSNLNTLDGGVSQFALLYIPQVHIACTNCQARSAENFLRAVCNLMTDLSALELVSLSSAYMFSVAGGIQILLVLASSYLILFVRVYSKAGKYSDFKIPPSFPV